MKTQNKVIQSGSNHKIIDTSGITIWDKLPAQNYRVVYNQQHDEYSLEPIGEFSLPSKTYGNSVSKSTRILNTFQERSNSTGVLLQGTKGSGKTLLSKAICIEALEQGVPSIGINEAYVGETFLNFIQSIDIPTIILFDEFEKTYRDQKKQEQLLTLFDGVYSSKKLFILTVNNENALTEFIKNRPSRIFYNIKYSNLEVDTIVEYCEDKKVNKNLVGDIVRYCKINSNMNFDMLVSLVEELNRYGESVEDCVSMLNISPESKYGVEYKLTIQFGDIEEQFYTTDDYDYSNYSITFECIDIEPYKKSSPEWHQQATQFLSGVAVTFNNEDLVRFDEKNEQFIYEIENNGVLATMKATKQEKFNSKFKGF